MKNKFLINLIMTLLFLGGIGFVYGQTDKYSKTGNDPFNLDSGAASETASTGRGFLPPHMDKTQYDSTTAANRVALSATAEGVATEGNTFKISEIQTPFNTKPVKPFQAICDGSVPTTVVDIPDSNGTIWMDRNLGASRAALSVDDYQAFGCLFQWGRGNDGAASVNWLSATSGRFTNGITVKNARSGGDTPGNRFIPIDRSPYNWRSTPNTALWQGVNGKNNPCPTGYRIPTRAEFQKSVIGTMEAVDANYTKLKFINNSPSTIKKTSGSLLTNNERSVYWTSDLYNNYKDLAYAMFISFGSYTPYGIEAYPISWAASVRCIKD